METSRLPRQLAMLGKAVRYARATAANPAKIARLARAFAADPVTVARAFPGEWRQKHAQHPPYADSDWDESWYEHLHGLLGAPWPCPETEQLHSLLADVSELLTAKGLGTGRHTYGWDSDAESALSRAIWCAVRHARPEVVIETGVAHGVSSRIVLEAFARNDLGHLWSIDLPHPLDRSLHAQTGAAVTDSCRPRWSYLEGPSRRLLPPLVKDVGHVELFIHDSLHTAENTLFEMEQAASAMSAGGVMLVDDIRGHHGFRTFSERNPDYRTLLCQTPDGLGGFGVAIKAEAPPIRSLPVHHRPHPRPRRGCPLRGGRGTRPGVASSPLGPRARPPCLAAARPPPATRPP